MSQHHAIQHMMRNPSAHMKYIATGSLPREHVIQSPLIDLLEKLGPGRLQQIRGLTIDHRLGYMGSREFQWASQGLRWLKPTEHMFSSPASESHQNKRFQSRLYLEDIQDCSREFPERLLQDLRHLCRPEHLSNRKAAKP